MPQYRRRSGSATLIDDEPEPTGDRDGLNARHAGALERDGLRIDIAVSGVHVVARKRRTASAAAAWSTASGSPDAVTVPMTSPATRIGIDPP